MQPNLWGLFDMHGSEFEWVFAAEAVPPEFSGPGIVRGGNFASTAAETSGTARTAAVLSEPTNGAFRIVMEFP